MEFSGRLYSVSKDVVKSVMSSSRTVCPTERIRFARTTRAPTTRQPSFRGVGFRCRAVSKENETPKEKLDRRLRESQTVVERVIDIYNYDDFQREVEKGDGKLVVLEVQSDKVCQSGLDEEPEMHWNEEEKERAEELWGICREVKHLFQRTARECGDVKFLELNADTDSASELCDRLDIDTLPTLQFYREGKLLWEHKGALEWQQDLGEGVLYYGDTFAGGQKASKHVVEIESEEAIMDFVQEQDDDTLAVLYISLDTAEPCIRIYPAVLALARNFKGSAAFARFTGDESAATQDLFARMGVVDVPTFFFFRGGKLIDRHVGSSRGDLIGHILQLQNAMGIPPPPTMAKGGTKRKTTSKR